MSERELDETLRVETLNECSCGYQPLFDFPRMCHDAVKTVVNELYSLDNVSSMKTLRETLYGEPRSNDLRVHCIKQIYVDATRRNWKHNEDRDWALHCRSRNSTGDRDVVTCINLFSKYSIPGAPEAALNTQKPMKTRAGCGEEGMKGVASTFI